ncbi:MAG: ATP-binding protein [Acidimicrobiaceae bacterium]|nr:ATP-binding protein [Acidimicrobiaceae bacterium]
MKAPHLSSQETSPETPDRYEMRISRLTVDKLGVKLYDRASAVVAELIANAYDADAENVTVTLPLAKQLARKLPDKSHEDLGFTITVRDDGHGMTPGEAQKYFLIVGTDRRKRTDSSGSPAKDAAKSRKKKRAVMGRKGIGKLAPFGICRRIEVISSGGNETTNGFLTSHFTLDFDKIVTDEDSPVPIDAGSLDRTYRAERGTLVRLSLFLPKRVPDGGTFRRQLERRFALARDDFSIKVSDSESGTELAIRHFQIPIDTTTRISVDNRTVRIENDHYPVVGWLAHAKEAYKDEESAGVRIYARGKIVATTRDFEQPAGFTGEFATRSYLVGEIHAEWLDDDEDEDLVRTDRQSILWDSEKGDAFRQWGKVLIKEVAGLAAGPRRDSKAAQFLRASRLQQRAKERYDEADIVDAVVELGKKIGGFAAEDELGDPDYVNDLAEVVLAVAPHQALIGAFKTISGQDDATLDDLLDVFGKARIAEMASYAQIAFERVRSIDELKRLLGQPGTSEADLHLLIAEAPWLIRPDWSVITVNQSLKTFRDLLVDWLRKHGHGEFEIAITHERKQPDFTLISVGRSLYIVELKKPGHSFGKSDYERLENYVVALENLFATHAELKSAFPDGWKIDLIADFEGIGDVTAERSFTKMKEDQQVTRRNWHDFLLHATTAHEQFLDAHDHARDSGIPSSE